MATLDQPQRFDLLRLGFGDLVQVEQRARHAIEQRDLLLVVQPVGAATDRARFGVSRHGVHVVLGLAIVVAEIRQRRDRERSERSVDGTINFDCREVVLGCLLVFLRLPLRIREIDVSFRDWPSSCGRTRRCWSRRAARWWRCGSGSASTKSGGCVGDRGLAGRRSRRSRRRRPSARGQPGSRSRRTRATRAPIRAPCDASSWLVVTGLIAGILSPKLVSRRSRSLHAAQRHESRPTSGTFSLYRSRQMSIMARPFRCPVSLQWCSSGS